MVDVGRDPKSIIYSGPFSQFFQLQKTQKLHLLTLSSEAEIISISNLTTVFQPPYSVTFAKGGGELEVCQWCRLVFGLQAVILCWRAGLCHACSRRLFRKTQPPKWFSSEKVSLSHPVWQKYLRYSLVQLVLLTLIRPSICQVIPGKILWMVLSLRCPSRLRKKFSIVLGWARRDFYEYI